MVETCTNGMMEGFEHQLVCLCRKTLCKLIAKDISWKKHVPCLSGRLVWKKIFVPLLPHITGGCKDYCYMTKSLLLPARASGSEHNCSNCLALLEMLVNRSGGACCPAARSHCWNHCQVLPDTPLTLVQLQRGASSASSSATTR